METYMYKKKNFCYLLLFVLTMLSIFMLTACGKEVALDQETAVIAITNEYTDLIGYDETENNPLISTLYSGFEVNVEGITESEEGYIVSCTFSNYDIKAAFEQMENQTGEMSLNEYVRMLSEVLRECDRVSAITEMTVVQNENGEYVTQFNEKQFDQAMGGFLTYYAEWMEE